MLKIDIKNLYMEYGERKLFFIKSQQIFTKDKIGIVGGNGVGKSTLLNIIANKQLPTSGSIKAYDAISYIEQEHLSMIDDSLLYKWHVDDSPNSAGEITRRKIASALSERSGILLCDEPTSNLDEKAILLLEKALINYKGTVILVSHDRKLMEKVCNKIWDMEDKSINVFNGSYSDFIYQKQIQRDNQQKEFDKYQKEKKNIESAIRGIDSKASGMKHTPKRMGNSEARLHRMDVRQKAGKVSGGKKKLQSRLDKLKAKEKPKLERTYVMTNDIKDGELSKIAVQVNGLSYSYGNSTVLDNISFDINKREKISITGDNGSGKTTLLKCIVNKEQGTKISPRYTVGYFGQNRHELDDNSTIIDSIMKTSLLREHMARIVLARMGIRTDEVYKKISVLSGGEKCKVSLSSLICQRCSMLILDEPTNYLDIYVLKALEDMLVEYDGTLLLVSHDRYFREKVTSKELRLTGGHLIQKAKKAVDAQLMLLEINKAKILSSLSGQINEEQRDKLETEYNDIIKEINILKK